MYNFEYEVGTSPITNCWETARTAHLRLEEFTVFRGRAGASYNHAPFLTSLDGRLLGVWVQGNRDEGYPGQRVACAWSDDLGETWSGPEFIVNTEMGKFSTKLSDTGSVRVKNGTLTAYYSQTEFPEEAIDNDTGLPYNPSAGMFHRDQIINANSWAKVSKDKGETWSKPVKVLEGAQCIRHPKEIKGGRLIMPCMTSYAYTDDPEGLSGWKRSAMPGRDPRPDDTDRSMWLGYFDKPHRGVPYMWNESDFFQTDDGVIHNMLRNGSHKQVYGVTESRDNGETWSEPKLTSYTDQGSKPNFGRLPDGRFFGLTTPYPRWETWNSFFSSVRTPLIMSLSEDGVKFDRHFIVGDKLCAGPRFKGLHKGGMYGYPDFHIIGDQGFIIYALNCKEDIMIARFKMSELD
jgi:hypothetical protein